MAEKAMNPEAEVPGITEVVEGLDDDTLLRSMLTAAAGVFKRDTLTDAHPRLTVARDRAAALMAAGPDLVKALKVARRWIRPAHDLCDAECTCVAAMDRAAIDEALAKADPSEAASR